MKEASPLSANIFGKGRGQVVAPELSRAATPSLADDRRRWAQERGEAKRAPYRHT